MGQAFPTFALVTGASHGIGLEIARLFAKDGHGIVAVADRQDRLDSAATELRAAGAPRVETMTCDLAEPGAPERLYEAVKAHGITPDFLVANAGIGVYGDFARETSLDDELRMINLNVISTVALTKCAAADMAARGSGKILITSSVAALAPSPKLAVYSATKAFDFAFAEAIANELKDSGVTVTALMPGPVETDFFARAHAENSKVAQQSKADPRDVAQAGYDAMMRGADHVLTPFTTKLSAALTSVLPASMATSMARAD